MSFQYKNPTSDRVINSPFSVQRENDQGTNFSVESVGGYMEVFTLNDLNWIIDPQTLIDGGSVLYSGNTIPISFGYNTPFSIPNTLNVNNDSISSGLVLHTLQQLTDPCLWWLKSTRALLT